MTAVFIAAALLAVLGAVGVVAARIPIHSVLALILNFVALAVLYLSLDAEFMALIQVIIYAGAVMVLFVFVIGLLTTRKEAPEGAERLAGQRMLAGMAGGAVALLLGLAALSRAVAPPAGVPADFGSVASFGSASLTRFVFPFELTAFVLMIAVVGVVVLVGRREP